MRRDIRTLLTVAAAMAIVAPFPSSALVEVDVPTAGSPSALVAQLATIGPTAPHLVVDLARQAELRGQPAWRRFEQAHPSWQCAFDLASGRPRRMFGDGIPMLPGSGNLLTVAELTGKADATSLGMADRERVALEFLSAWSDLFAIVPGEWSIEPSDSKLLKSGALQMIVLSRQIDGIRVRDAAIVLAVSNGNLVYLHAYPLDDIEIGSEVAVSAEAAVAVATGAADPGIVELLAGPALELITVPAVGGPAGSRAFSLVWSLRFRFAGYQETWAADIDARSGDIVALRDSNAYACELGGVVPLGRVEGGVRPASGLDPEELRYFPFTLVLDPGNKTTDYNGWFPFSGDNATSGLDGTYFNTNNTGGAQPAAASNTSGDINFGFGGNDQNSNGMSTRADRTSFYHLNVARAIGAKWLNLPWFATNVPVNVNFNNTCNAFWNGTSLNFYRSGNGCPNTGEIRDVMQHEWGHGLDANDGGGGISDSAMSEAVGDAIALFVDHDSCIGQSFLAGRQTGPYCLQIPGCPATLECDGVRNIDEQRANRGILTTANVATKCSPSTGCGGPLNRECHCEGEILGQALFHLIQNLLTGRDYSTGTLLPGSNPAFSNTAAWYILEKDFFVGQASGVRTYHPTAGGMSTYDGFVLADDDDNNLANGTPNGAYINNAFAHHGIDERPPVADSNNCTKPGDPVYSATPLISATGNSQVEIVWGDTNASFYNVYRRDAVIPDDVWAEVRSNVADTNAPTYTVYDEPVQNGLTFEYTILAVSSTGCVSDGNNVQPVTVALPQIDVASQQVTEPPPGGNGNARVDPGEYVRLRIDLREVDNLAGAQNVSVMLTTSDPDVIIVQDGPISYGGFAPGQQVNGPSLFGLAVDRNHLCGVDIPLAVLISSDDGCWAQATKIFIPTAGCAPCPGCVVCQVAPAAVAIGSTQICAGDTTLLDASSSVASGCAATLGYQWLLDGSPLSGETNATYATPPTLAGRAMPYEYDVQVSCAGDPDCNDRLTVPVAVAVTSVTPAATASAVGICAGAMATFDASTSTSAGCGNPLTYQWYLDGAPVAGETSVTYRTDPALGTGRHQVHVEVACPGGAGCSEALAPIDLDVASVTALATSWYADICQGAQATFDASASIGNNCGGPLSYQWFVDGLAVPGAINPTYTTDVSLAPGAHMIHVEVSCNAPGGGTCTDARAPSRLGIVAATPLVAAPDTRICKGTSSLLDASASMLLGCASAATYQWHVDGVLVPGAVNPTYLTDPSLAPGVHQVQVVVGCSGLPACAAALSPPIALRVESLALRCSPGIVYGAVDAWTPVGVASSSDPVASAFQWSGGSGTGSFRNGTSRNQAEYLDSVVGSYTLTLRADGDFGGLMCSETCTVEANIGTCAVASFNPVPWLWAAKSLTAPDEVSFVWRTEPSSPPAYHVNVVQGPKGNLLDPRSGGAPGNGSIACTDLVGSLACTDAQPPIASWMGALYYQVLSACDASVGNEGPF